MKLDKPLIVASGSNLVPCIARALRLIFVAVIVLVYLQGCSGSLSSLTEVC